MSDHHSYLSSAKAMEQGRTAYYKMLENVRQGELIQVRRGVYASIDQLCGNMIDINTLVPGGFLCLWSAWDIHHLTTSTPQVFPKKPWKTYTYVTKNMFHHPVKKVVRHVYRIKEQLTDGPSLTPCGGNLVLRSGKYGRFYGC